MENYNIVESRKDSVAEDTAVVVCNDLVTVKIEIPEEERALEAVELDELDGAKKFGFFSPVQGMGHIKNALGDQFFARIYQRESGVRYVQYCQKYRDGSFSPKMLILQADMRIAARFDFISKGIPENKIRNKVSGFILATYTDYLGKFSGELEEEYGIEQILRVLLQAMPSLPVCMEEPDEMTPEDLYRSVIYYVKETALGKLDEHRLYYTMDDECMEYVAEALKLKKKELLKKLKEYGLLYLAKSSRGFKTNVRVKYYDGSSDTEWFYCLYKLESFMNT